MPKWRDVVTGLLCLAVAPACADPSARGFVLAASCSSCHGVQAANAGIPSILGMDQARIERSLLAYRTGQRPSQIMQVVAASLTPDEIALVARYLASRQPGAAR